MEAATLSSPQRKYEVVPVQKSLSLPSYARAGGEGIDHRIIFAALEQKEKIRRKSRIFTREKSSRQNIFCLPISSSAKCRETSLSSDTSCSSLEYQKPKSTPKPKKKETKPSNNEIAVNELSTAKTNQPEIKANQSHNDVVAEESVVEKEQELQQQKDLLKVVAYAKDHRSPSNTLRPNVNSSDSMERSSRSSNDSLSRKERLVAIKAKVEAAREKYGNSSSEDETPTSITRYNSDGVIHKTTVREVKSRSNRLEKRLRRRSQDEYALKKANRKNNLSLCLNSIEDGFKLDFNKPMNIYEDGQSLECKTDFCPSPNFLDFTKKNYFSDFPSKENMCRIVQTRIRHIEEEERRRRNSIDLREKIKFSSRQSPQSMEHSSPFSTQQRRNMFSNQNSINGVEADKNHPDAVQCPSPVSRSSQAPTPPPRSPKSMTFINKAYIQHQNSILNHDSRSLERKPFCSNVPITSQSKSPDLTNSKNDLISNGTKMGTDGSLERRKMKELLSSRRKTCGYFDYPENYLYKEMNVTEKHSISTSVTENVYTSQCSPKSPEAKAYLFNSETPYGLSEDAKKRIWMNKWEENDKRHEFMFNSLESKKKVMSPSWAKWVGIPQRNDPCLCYLVSGNKASCSCNHKEMNIHNKIPDNSTHVHCKTSPIYANLNEVEAQQACNRLSKSEINIAYSEQPKPSLKDLKFDMCGDFRLKETKLVTEKVPVNDAEKLSATANLESAMEELESVYRSLKLSCDNLSEKSSTSNLALNDLNADNNTKHNDFSSRMNSDSQSKSQTPLKENNLDFYHNKPNYCKPISDKKQIQYSKSFACSSPTNMMTSKSVDSENICIDELFNDLTRQLDVEQKQLKDCRDNQITNVYPDKCNKLNQNRMTPLESIVSIRKELYDNLQKNSQEQIRATNLVPKGMDKNTENEMAKRKYKAVRCLSENISHLMAAANSPTVRKNSPDKTEPFVSSMETTIIEKSSPKHYEHVVLEPLKVETKTEVSLNNPIIPKRTFVADKVKNYGNEEIRQIRVSMDSNVIQSNPKSIKPLSNYPRLSSVVSRPQLSPKSDPSNRLPQTTNVPKETIDMLDENGLEKLLNTLLNDVPEPRQSSLLLSKGDTPATPPPPTVVSSGKSDHVIYKRNILTKMDGYTAASAKGKLSDTECSQRLKSEDIAQVKEFCQNSPHLNHASFIPVYSNKTVCHKFPKNECESPCSERKVLSTYSPPTRPRCLAGNNDMIATRVVKTHMRRRSVGFEDMTSLSSFYGHNFTNDRMVNERRFQGPFHNSNIPQASAESHSNLMNSDNSLPIRKPNSSENICFSSINHNSQLSSGENANDNQQRRIERPLQRYKDKSSKRKSSLNRMDFIHLPSSNNGSAQFYSDTSQQKNNSSSDEGSESKFRQKKSESPSSTSKRKHSASNTVSKNEMKTNEATLSRNSPTKVKCNLLPRSSYTKHSNPRQIRWKQTAAIQFSQKLSHSAGELESLTDFSEVPSRNKTYLSAQEYDDYECSATQIKSNNSEEVTAKHSIQKLSPRHLFRNEHLPPLNICDNTSQVNTKNESLNHFECNVLTKHNDSNDSATNIDCNNLQSVDQKENITSDVLSEQNNETVDSVSLGLNLDCDDSIEYIDAEVDTSAIQLESLEITDNESKTDIYLSADEAGEVIGSDGERRPSSILRKKSFEEKRELHSILKPPPEDKTSKTPHSILKNRESSEEKETWQLNDLHSILKKSTSEDESCNSGPDIRPILKLSTDEDSPSGAVRPRPILKKRTSFSDECSYVSFPSGELKPILKKKTPLSSDDQPKPILKSRRKSEDTRSLTEVITSRPRAYSADMGVKISHESLDGKIKDHKFDSHDL